MKKAKIASAAILGVLSLVLGVTTASADPGRSILMSCGSPPTYSSSIDLYWPGDIKYKKHPRKCTYSVDGSMATTVVLEKIKWHGTWGGKNAKAQALRVDNHDQNGDGFQRHPVRIVVSRPRHAVGKRTGRRYYTRLKVVDREFGPWTMALYKPGKGPIYR